MTDIPALAYKDPKFIESDEGRPIRIISEYLAPLQALSAAGVSATVVFFGSARARAGGALGRYVDEATELARLVTQWSCATATAVSWCAPAVAPGSWRRQTAAPRSPAAAASVLTSACRTSSCPNPYITPGLCFEFHYFFMRKLWFAHLAHALVVFPGGFGTLR